MTEPVSLFEQLRNLQAQKQLRPVADWQPEQVGEIDIRIAKDGTWYHEGKAIQRKSMVKLFASVLRRDDDGFCLVTPAEKLFIQVEDVPFLAVDMEIKGSGRTAELLFITNLDDYVILDGSHPLRVEEINDEPRPYINVRDGLDALLARALFYRLVDLAEDENRELVVYSCGERFSLGTY